MLENQLKDEEKLIHLIQQMPTAVYTINQEGILTFYNQKAVELWGYHPRLNDPKESRYCGSFMIFKPDGTPLPHDKSPAAIALRQKKKIDGEEIIIERPDGSRVTALVNISPLFEDGKFSGTINVLQEITARKKNEKAAWLLVAIVNSSDDAIISKTLTGLITSWNPAAEKIFGFTETEMLGQSITAIIPADRQNEEEMIIRSIRKGKKVDHFETIRKAKDGKHVSVSITVSPVRDSVGRIIGASKIARKITGQGLKD